MRLSILVRQCGLLLLAALFSGMALAKDQLFTFANVIADASAGGFVRGDITYAALGSDTGIHGFALRVHYKSDEIDSALLQQDLSRGALGVGGPVADHADYDSNPLTDKFYILAWQDVVNPIVPPAGGVVASFDVNLAQGQDNFSPLGLSVVASPGYSSAGRVLDIENTQLQDFVPPVITAPSDIRVAAVNADGVSRNSSSITSFLSTASAIDDVDGVITGINNNAPVVFPLGDTVVTFTVSDVAENTGSRTATVTVEDQDKPVLSIPSSLDINLSTGNSVPASNNAILNFLAGASATDNVDGTVTVLNNAPSEYGLGETVVIFTAMDAASNSTSGPATVTVSSLDNDSDGMPNSYELLHQGLDINSPDDSGGDLDGDGLSNLEEYQQGFDIAVDDVFPVLMIPSNVTVNSTGPTTPVDLGLATAEDFKDGTIIPDPDNSGPYVPGRNIITWSAADQSGNVATDQQTVDVIPLVSFTTSQSVDEGSGVTVSLSLNGSPVAYPVVVPFTVSGSADSSADHDLVDGDITIESPDTSATLNFLTTVDDVWEGDETVLITMGTPTNAVEGSMTSHSVTIKEENIEPVVTLGIAQGGKPVTTITADGGLVTLTATIDDPNPTDQHVVDWSQTNNNLVPTNGYNNGTFLFDPSLLTAGLYNVEVSATDDGQGQLTSMTDSMLRVISTAPVLSAGNDSDGDGVSDLDEGTGDSDQDRIPDYLDSVDAANQLPSNDNDAVMQVDNGLKLRLGETAFAADVPAAQVTVQDLVDHGGSGGGVATNAEDNAYQFPSGVFDFEVSGTVPGDSVRVVIPQSSAVPANAVYRKYTSGTGWFDFSINAKNSVASAQGALGICPAPGDASYIIGLTEGHFCVQLTIEDGGNNDADNQVNGVVKDPGGVAVQLIPVPVVGLAKTETSSTTFNSGDGEQVVFAFSLSSDSTDAEVHEFTVSASGEMDVTTDIDSVTLYRDDNKNGIPEAVESVAIGSVDADNGDLSFALPQAYQLPVGDTHFLVTYQF